MNFRSRILFSPTVIAAFFLCACAPQQDEAANGDTPEQAEIVDPTGGTDGSGDARSTQSDAPDASGEFSTVSETGWLTIGADGAVQTTYFDTDGRYRDFRNGEAVAEGEWRRDARDRVCFEPEAGRGACWSIDQPDDDGEAAATNADGKVIAIRRVAYMPPENNDDENGEPS